MYVLKNKFSIALIFLFDLIGIIITTPMRLFKGHIKSNIKNARKILIIRLDHIGDIIFATSTFRAIKEAYPDAKLHVLINRQNKDIVKHNPYVEQIMTYDAPWFRRKGKRFIKLAEFLRLADVLKNEKYDIGIDLRGDLRHIILMSLAKIRYKIGYGTTGAGFLLDKEVEYRPYAHETEHNADLLESMGVKYTHRKSEFFIPQESAKFAQDFYASAGIKGDDFVVCIHPGSGYSSKRWLSKKWAQLTDKLSYGLKAKVIVIGVRDDKTLIGQIKSMVKTNIIDASGKTSIEQLAAIIKKANVFIGTDSGPSHIASAVDTSAVILYSGTNFPSQWAPQNKNITIIKKDIPCVGCERQKCPNNICMDLITVDEVMEAAKHVSRL